MSVIGMDIGGANLKLAHSDGKCLSHPFALWRHPERLGEALAALLHELPAAQTLAVTMTGELADCFTTKREGVGHILNSVQNLAKDCEIRVWSTSGEFIDPRFAVEYPLLVAAANWHALATWAGRLAPEGCSLLIDIGTTTTDVIPLENGYPVSQGLTDLQRLQHRELEYTGVSRTPLFALAHSVPFRDGQCALAAELFATTLDLYLWTGELPEDLTNLDTANGRPATRDAARNRLCRMLCADRDEIADDELDRMCQFLTDVQRSRIAGCLEHVTRQFSGTCETVILSGSGAFLAEQALQAVAGLKQVRSVRLSEMISPEAAKAACAFAVARLAEDC